LDEARGPIERGEDPLEYVGWLRVLLKADARQLQELYEAAGVPLPDGVDRIRQIASHSRRKRVNLSYAKADDAWASSTIRRVRQLFVEQPRPMTAGDIQKALNVPHGTVLTAISRLARTPGVVVERSFSTDKTRNNKSVKMYLVKDSVAA
jgi:hypothetical protein